MQTCHATVLEVARHPETCGTSVGGHMPFETCVDRRSSCALSRLAFEGVKGSVGLLSTSALQQQKSFLDFAQHRTTKLTQLAQLLSLLLDIGHCRVLPPCTSCDEITQLAALAPARSVMGEAAKYSIRLVVHPAGRSRAGNWFRTCLHAALIHIYDSRLLHHRCATEPVTDFGYLT